MTERKTYNKNMRKILYPENKEFLKLKDKTTLILRMGKNGSSIWGKME
jgi:hypothetical protein